MHGSPKKRNNNIIFHQQTVEKTNSRKVTSLRKKAVVTKKKSGGGGSSDNIKKTVDTNIKWELIGASGNYALSIRLQDGQTIIADGGAMAYMDGDIEMETNMGGLGKALGRMFSGEDLFLNHFHGKGKDQQIVFSSPLPSDIIKLDVPEGRSWKLSRGSFLVGTENLEISGKLNIRGLVPFGQDEGLVLTKVTAKKDQGTACAWICSYGHITLHDVPSGKTLMVDNENFLACDVDTEYQLSKVGGVKSLIFGGEGLVMKFKGPCSVYTQSKGIQGLAGALIPYIPVQNA